LLRKSAALVAAYAIALQALLSGLVPTAHAGFDEFGIICTSDATANHQPSSPPAHHCDACLAGCSHAPALLPASFAFSTVVFVDRPQHPVRAVELAALKPTHQPHASRAPPRSS
jgi:hypothetical protein